MFKGLEKYLSPAAIAEIARTATSVIEIKASAAQPLALTASRLGGIGYWPENRPYPHGSSGQPLALLAQFNFAELPRHPDLPDSGILAFYINPFSYSLGLDYDDPSNRADYLSIYFPDLHTPSLSREAQRDLFPPSAFPDREAQSAEEPDADTLAFQARWQQEAAEMLHAWLMRRGDAVAHIDDAELSRLWQAENAALPPLAELVAHINDYYRDVEQQLPGNAYAFAYVLDDDYFPQTVARIAELAQHPQIVRWDMAIKPYSAEELAQSVYFHQVFSQQMLTSGDPRWHQYWQHNPQAVIEYDWHMQGELFAAYQDAEGSRLWQATLSEMRANLAQIVHEAQQRHVMSAPELDQLLEHYAEPAMTRLRAAFTELSPARQMAIREIEARMIGERMDRLAAHFATLGFVAEGEAPHDIHEALRQFSALAESELQSNDPIAAMGKLMEGVGQSLFAIEPETPETENDTDELLSRYIAENDAYIAEQADPTLSRLWQEERDALHSRAPLDRNAFAMHLQFTSPTSKHLLQQGIISPVASAIASALFGVDYSAAGTDSDWSHPVDGEWAIEARLASHYLIHDSDEFEAHYGMPGWEWWETQSPQAQSAIAQAQQQEKIDRILRSQHESHLLGYPLFAQTDPRQTYPEPTILLFQLDSDDEHGIMWGDSGACQFFIRREDLQARRFEHCWFNWDCY